MTLIEVIGLAWEGLVLNKLRSFLTTLGVIIGVAAVILMIAISAGAEAAIADQINALGANLIIVTAARGVPGRPPTLVYDDALAIGRTVKGITGVAAEQNLADQLIKWGNVSFTTPALGTTPDFPVVRGAPLGVAHFFTQADLDRKNKVIVLGSKVAQDLFGEVSPVDQEVVFGTTRLTVIGVMAPKGKVADTDYDDRVYIPLTVLYQRFLANPMMNNRVRTVYAQATSRETMDSAISQIKSVLAQQHGVTLANPDFIVQTQEDIIQTQQATTETFRTLLGWVAAVSLLVGGIGIMNIMLVSVTERTREIGVRVSIGARPQDVRRQFLLEAMILSLFGGLIGVIAGVGGAWLFDEMGAMRTVLVPWSLGLAFVASAVVGIFFGYFPATKAANLDPIEALRHE
ncbi:MAG: FtsX-like permease family protein [Chloroflexi bacterium]|nr:FtsX-like permease family protein [Chloroflexota bacterium]